MHICFLVPTCSFSVLPEHQILLLFSTFLPSSSSLDYLIKSSSNHDRCIVVNTVTVSLVIRVSRVVIPSLSNTVKNMFPVGLTWDHMNSSCIFCFYYKKQSYVDTTNYQVTNRSFIIMQLM